MNGGPLAALGPTYTTAMFTNRVTTAFGAETAIFSGANSNYQALSVQLNHRMSHNIQFGANYTWAHALDEAGGDWNGSALPSNLFNVRSDYGNSNDDVRHRMTMSFSYALPQKEGPWPGRSGKLARYW